MTHTTKEPCDLECDLAQPRSVLTGWEAGTRTPIPRSRAVCPTIERLPSPSTGQITGLRALCQKNIPSGSVGRVEMAERESA